MRCGVGIVGYLKLFPFPTKPEFKKKHSKTRAVFKTLTDSAELAAGCRMPAEHQPSRTSTLPSETWRKIIGDSKDQ